MINDKTKLIPYLDVIVDRVFKILPLFEENNRGLKTYVDSLLFELYGLEKVFEIEDNEDYISILSILESVKIGMSEASLKKPVLKREVFKCINIIKIMISKLEKSD